MKKLLIIICLKMFVFSCFPVHRYNSNDNLDQTDRYWLLNETEGAFLNKIFETTRTDFDFVNKKIGFLTGSTGSKKSNKKEYFDMHEKHSTNANSPCDKGTLYIFNAEQKEKSGGYDATIVYWSKFLLPVEQVVKKMRSQR